MEYSDVEVKAKLGLSKLKGEALKAHPNFVWYQDYLRGVEKNKLDLWLSDKKSPRVVFQEFGLNNMVHPKLSDKHQTYLRYATMYDDKVVKGEGSAYRYTPWSPGFSRKPDGSEFSFPPFYPQTPAEKKIYVEIWANVRRENACVKKMLGVKDGSVSANKRYYEEFKRLKQEKCGFW